MAHNHCGGKNRRNPDSSFCGCHCRCHFFLQVESEEAAGLYGREKRYLPVRQQDPQIHLAMRAESEVGFERAAALAALVGMESAHGE